MTTISKMMIFLKFIGNTFTKAILGMVVLHWHPYELC